MNQAILGFKLYPEKKRSQPAVFPLFFCMLLAASCTTAPYPTANDAEGSPEVVSGPGTHTLPAITEQDGSGIPLLQPVIDIPDFSNVSYGVYKKKVKNAVVKYPVKETLPKVVNKEPGTSGTKKSMQKSTSSSNVKTNGTVKNTGNQGTVISSTTNKGSQTGTKDATLKTKSSTVTNPETDKSTSSREVGANPGDDIEISFNRDGWIFLGFEKPEDSSGIAFQNRKSSNNQTLFTFKAIRKGAYNLNFSRQDNYTKSESRENVAVSVESPAESGVAGTGKSAQTVNDMSAEELYNARSYKEALARYLEGKNGGSPFVTDRIAELYKRTGNPDEAMKYWQNNLRGPVEYADKAAIEIAKLYTQKNDKPGLYGYASQLPGIEGVPPERFVTLVANYLDTSGDSASGIRILSDFVVSYPHAKNGDELFFLLGKFYEKHTPLRDLKKSRMYYMKVCDEYPESLLVNAATERIMYLNRYFFNIQ